jgi:cytochrome c oxidase subunit 4
MAHAEADHHAHHIVPLKLLWGVFTGLVILTIVTVLTAKFVDLGSFNLTLAIMIAIAKASLVVTFFMALKWDNRINALVLALGCIFVLVFLSFTLFDTAFRGDMEHISPNTIMDEERMEEALRSRENALP